MLQSKSPAPYQRQCENWLQTYLQYTEFTEAPVAFHFWTAISVLAGAVERRVWIDLGAFQWVPNFFILLVAKPGIATKSTTLRIGKNLLRKTGKAHFGPDSLTWQALLDSFADASHEFRLENGDRIRQTPLSLWVSEFGNFFQADNRELIDLLVDMWDGAQSTFTRRTKGEGEKAIVNPWMSFLACTTPSWLQANFTTEMVGGGFASRVIMVNGDSKRHLIAYPGISSGGIKAELEAPLLADLKHITTLTGPMHLTKEALEWGEQWYRDFNKVIEGKNCGRLGGYFARKQTHMHKIAMMLSIAESSSKIITLNHLRSAAKILDGVEKDISKAMSSITNRQLSTKNSTELFSILESHGKPITKVEAFSLLYTFMASRDFDAAVIDLQRAGLIKVTALPGGNAKLSLIPKT